MPDETPADGNTPAAPTPVRPQFIIPPRTLPGDEYHGGAVVRIFLPYRMEGYLPTTVGAAIVHALGASQCAPGLVVLPAGVGVIDTVTLATEDWTDVDRRAVAASIDRWVRACGDSLPPCHPPVVLGLDGSAVFGGGDPWEQAVQVAVVIQNRRLAHVTAKTKPTNDDEATALDVSFNLATNLPSSTAVFDNQPVATIGEESTLLLVCHDAAAFSARSRSASRRGGAADMIRRQYDDLLARCDAPLVAINLLHQLPRRAGSRLVTSSVFQNAHRALHDEYLVRVIAVSGLHPDETERAATRLHALLRCDFLCVDVALTIDEE